MPNSKQEAYHTLIQPPWNNGRAQIQAAKPSRADNRSTVGARSAARLSYRRQWELFNAVLAATSADLIQAAIPHLTGWGLL